MIELADFDRGGWWSRLSLRRFLGGVAVFVALAAIWLLASWLNQQRYHLIVELAEIRVERGVFLPLGRRPFVPKVPDLVPAYAPARLPPGFATAMGNQVFLDRVQLDQALLVRLQDAARYALGPSAEDAAPRDLDAAERLLDQIDHIPGSSPRQRDRLDDLRRLLEYHRARQVLSDARVHLARARAWLRGRPAPGAMPEDAQAWAQKAEAALDALQDPPGPGSVGSAAGMHPAARTEDMIAQPEPEPEPELEPDSSSLEDRRSRDPGVGLKANTGSAASTTSTRSRTIRTSTAVASPE